MTGAVRAAVMLVVVLCATSGVGGCSRRHSPPPAEEETISTSSVVNQEGTYGRRRSSLSISELHSITEDLLNADVGLGQPSINLQGKTSSSSSADNAHQSLISFVPRDTMNKETVREMRQLLNNYNPMTTQLETQTDTERREELSFLTSLLRTSVMQRLSDVLRENDLLPNGKDLRQVLDDIWFSMYRRGGRHLASSGFEHVFVGEVKDGKVSGFHNWLNLYKEELADKLDYKGYMKAVDLGGKGTIIKARFTWLTKEKPVGTVFVGTTPELEMALYTLCFLVQPNTRCPVRLNGHRFKIQTWSLNRGGKQVVGSAYPEI